MFDCLISLAFLGSAFTYIEDGENNQKLEHNGNTAKQFSFLFLTRYPLQQTDRQEYKHNKHVLVNNTNQEKSAFLTVINIKFKS